DREALELRMAKIVHAVRTGVLVRGAEILRFRPGREIVLARPDGVRGEQRVAFGLVLRSAQELEFLEAGHFVELRIAALPDILERLFRALLYLETIHCDEHGFPFRVCPTGS